MESKEMALLAAQAIDKKKGTDIVIIDISMKSAVADYMMIASGNSVRQISALKDSVEEELEKEGVFVRSIEGPKESGWLLMDYSDIIVNLMTEEKRQNYDLENVWGDCERIPTGVED